MQKRIDNDLTFYFRSKKKGKRAKVVQEVEPDMEMEPVAAEEN